MGNIKEQMKQDARRASKIRNGQNAKNLDLYSVTATLYGEAQDLDDKGITMVAETIRNRHDFYNKNKINGTDKISYRDVVGAKNQYDGFNRYKNNTIKDFQEIEKNLSPENKKKWDRCKAIANKVVNGQLKTDYAHGAIGFNKASVEANKKAFKTNKVFKDDSCFANDRAKRSPHVFIADFELSSLKDAQGKIIAKGGNPSGNKSQVLAQNKITQRRGGRG